MVKQEQIFSTKATDALFEALRKGWTKRALEALDQGADPNGVRDEARNSPLIVAALYFQPQVTKALLDKGADPDYARRGGDTALMMTALSNDRESAKAIVDAGANILRQNNANRDAMMCASAEGNRALGDLMWQWAEEREARLGLDTITKIHQNIRDMVARTVTIYANDEPAQRKRPKEMGLG